MRNIFTLQTVHLPQLYHSLHFSGPMKSSLLSSALLVREFARFTLHIFLLATWLSHFISLSFSSSTAWMELALPSSLQPHSVINRLALKYPVSLIKSVLFALSFINAITTAATIFSFSLRLSFSLACFSRTTHHPVFSLHRWFTLWWQWKQCWDTLLTDKHSRDWHFALRPQTQTSFAHSSLSFFSSASSLSCLVNCFPCTGWRHRRFSSALRQSGRRPRSI